MSRVMQAPQVVAGEPLQSRIKQDVDIIPPFKVVSQNLAKIGALTIEQFLKAPPEIDDFDVVNDTDEAKDVSPAPTNSILDLVSNQQVQQNMDKSIGLLHQTCQRAFGTSEALKFEFIELDGPSTKRCVLTIVRPNGARKSYTTPGMFSRKNEAKAQTAALSIEMGALAFITAGETDSSNVKNGLVLAPLNAHDSNAAPEVESPCLQEDSAIIQIEECCKEWRAGRVKPLWVPLADLRSPISEGKGYALRITLSPHSLRVYSTDTEFLTSVEAKAACAKIALDQGVLEFIKHGNGQVDPEKKSAYISEIDTQVGGDTIDSVQLTRLTLQEFYDTLPQPFPENFRSRSVADINGPSWLNTAMQSARGGKLSANFMWIIGKASKDCSGLHGSVLRIERPRDSRSYLVDPMFLKRINARSAVCLQAMSQGLGDYIRGVNHEMENKITPEMRRRANDVIFPILGSECNKLKPPVHPRYEFPKDKDAYGCTVVIQLSPSPKPDEIKTLSVPAEYRSKLDAKIALACAAAEQGLVEFLRFRGDPPPPGYQTFYSTLMNGTTNAPNKRKDRDDDGPQERKRSRVDTGRPPAPLLETKAEALSRMNARYSSNKGLKGPHGPRALLPPTPQRGWGPDPNDVVLPYGESEPSGSSASPKAGPVMPGVTRNQPKPPARLGHNPTQTIPAQSHWDPQSGSGSQATPYSLHGGYHAPPPTYYQHPQSNTPPSQPYSHSEYYRNPRPGPLLPAPSRYSQPYTSPINSASPHGPYPSAQYSQINRHPPSLPARESLVRGLPRSDSLDTPPLNSSTSHRAYNSSNRGAKPTFTSNTQTVPDNKTQPRNETVFSRTASLPRSNLTELFDYCTKNKVPRPQFQHKAITRDKDSDKDQYEVWCFMSNERLEIATKYASINEGQERISKLVLERLRSKGR